MSKTPKKPCDDLERVVQYHAAQVRFDSAAEQTELQVQLRDLAKEIASGLSDLESVQSKEILGTFVADLFLFVADEVRRGERRRKQAEGIAAAKTQGVRFGPSRKPLPDNFDECHRKWRDGELTMREAAEACGMAKSSFYGAVVRKEQSVGCAV